LLEPAVAEVGTWRQGRVLRVGQDLGSAARAPGISVEHHRAVLGPAVVAAEVGARGVEPECRRRLVYAVADLTRFHGTRGHPRSVGKEGCNMRR